MNRQKFLWMRLHRAGLFGWIGLLVCGLTLGLLFGLAFTSVPALAQNSAPLLDPFASWFSGDNDSTTSVAWGDVDGDGRLQFQRVAVASEMKTVSCLLTAEQLPEPDMALV